MLAEQPSYLLSFHRVHSGRYPHVPGQITVFGEGERLIHTNAWNRAVQVISM